MNARTLALGAFAILYANAAEAAVYFDTIHGITPSGFDGPASDAIPVMAESFYAPGTPNFSQISLTLSADKPTNSGSFMVYLVPDDGSGSGTGVAGSPLHSGGAKFTGYTNGVLLGTFGDRFLASTVNGSTVLTVNLSYATDAAVAANTKHNEYWIALVPSATSSVDWYYNGDNAGLGTANQNYYNSIGLDADSTGAYQMLVNTPEPGTLAILGGGLAAMGYLRRRRAK